MNKDKFKVAIKRFIQNKNTVTILCVLGSIIILYIGYQWRINEATKPRTVPYAIVDIQPRTLITEDMISTVEVPGSMVSANTVTAITEVLGKYANYNTVIPSGSLFYKSVLVTWDDMPDSAWANIPDGYTVVALPVNTDSTLGNSIYPGNYIDLYYQTTEKSSKLLLGKLIESIEVLSVKDSSGEYVFENSAETGTPAYLIFAVPEDLHLLLRKALALNGTVIPVQRNRDYTLYASATKVTSSYIQNYILSQTVTLPENDLPEIEDNTDDITNNNENNPVVVD